MPENAGLVTSVRRVAPSAQAGKFPAALVSFTQGKIVQAKLFLVVPHFCTPVDLVMVSLMAETFTSLVMSTQSLGALKISAGAASG